MVAGAEWKFNYHSFLAAAQRAPQRAGQLKGQQEAPKLVASELEDLRLVHNCGDQHREEDLPDGIEASAACSLLGVGHRADGKETVDRAAVAGSFEEELDCRACNKEL